MDLQTLLKKNGMSNIVLSIIFAILGIILCIFSNGAIKVISYLIGVLLIALGGYKIIDYIKNRGQEDFFNYNLLFGIVAIVGGMGAIIYTDSIKNIIGVIVSFWIIYSGITRAYLSFKLRSINSSSWEWIASLALSVIMCILGIYILFNGEAVVTLIGAFMIVFAVIDIIESIVFIKNVDDFM